MHALRDAMMMMSIRVMPRADSARGVLQHAADDAAARRGRATACYAYAAFMHRCVMPRVCAYARVEVEFFALLRAPPPDETRVCFYTSTQVAA